METEVIAFERYLETLGIRAGQHVMLHGSYRAIRAAFPGLTIQACLTAIGNRLTDSGSLIMPVFTYCFKKTTGAYDLFDYHHSPGKVGALSEVFRSLPGVKRTSSPTHSMALWGEAARTIDPLNAPASPLGRGSVPEWLAGRPQSAVLLLGVDFRSLTFGHYLETVAPVPWADVWPWDYLQVLPIGVSTHGEQPLREVPGCARGFINFQRYLLSRSLIRAVKHATLTGYLIPVTLLLEEGISFFKNEPEQLLCPASSCPACDFRRDWYQKRK